MVRMIYLIYVINAIQTLRWSYTLNKKLVQVSYMGIKGGSSLVLTLRPLLAAQNLLPPISLTVLTLTPKKYL